nr:hypothetical protein [Dictyobacter kobayashii]
MLAIFETIAPAHHHLRPIVFSFHKAIRNTERKKGQNFFPPAPKG